MLPALVILTDHLEDGVHNSPIPLATVLHRWIAMDLAGPGGLDLIRNDARIPVDD
jgi:hypothetical protein